MNNIEEMYKRERALLNVRTVYTNAIRSIYRANIQGETIEITLHEDLDEGLTKDEKLEVLEIIKEELRVPENMQRTEREIIDVLEDRLRECKKKVRKDIGIKLKED